jgi:hypothetical protein
VASSPASREAAGAEIRTLLNNLSSRDFRTREQATRALLSEGTGILPFVKEDLPEMDQEGGRRAIEIVGRMSRSPDARTSGAARNVLAQLRQSDNSEVASLAIDLESRNEGPPPVFTNPAVGRRMAAFPRIGALGPIRVQNAVQIQVGVNGAQVHSTEINGVRTLTLRQGTRSVEIRDTNRKDIHIRLRETSGKVHKSGEYTAADRKELNAKYPDVAAIYDQVTENFNLGTLQFPTLKEASDVVDAGAGIETRETLKPAAPLDAGATPDKDAGTPPN